MNYRRAPSGSSNPANSILIMLMEQELSTINKESNFAMTMRRAIGSVRTCEFTISSGVQAQSLKYVGPKVAQLIDRCLRSTPSAEIEGGSLDQELPSDAQNEARNAQVAALAAKRKKSASSTRKYSPRYRSGAWAILVALLKATNLDHQWCSKTYLQSKAQPYSDNSFQMEANAQAAASKPSMYYTAWSCVQNTLIPKGLIVRQMRRCAEFSLTREGYELATKLFRAYLHLNPSEESTEGQITIADSSAFEFPEPEFEDTADVPQPAVAATTKRRAVAKSTPVPSTSAPASYMYVQPDGTQTRFRSAATVQLIQGIAYYKVQFTNSSTFEWFPVSNAPETAPGAVETSCPNEDSDSDVELFDLSDDEADTPTVRISQTTAAERLVASLPESEALFETILAGNSKNGLSARTAAALLPTPTNSQCSANPSSYQNELTERSGQSHRLSQSLSQTADDFQSASQTSTSASDRVDDWNVPRISCPSLECPPEERVKQEVFHQGSHSILSPGHGLHGARDAITISQNDYDIVLLLDLREVTGSGARKKQEFFDSLINKSADYRNVFARTHNIPASLLPEVSVESRQLDCGDFLWIARKKTGDFPFDENTGDVAVEYSFEMDDEFNTSMENLMASRRIQRDRLQSFPRGTEIVLDFMVERKSVDDLASSIQDGRYYEQKYRMGKSGLSHIVYLVEGDVDQQTRLSPEALIQATISTSMHDGYIIKHVPGRHEAMEYILLMTYFVSKSYFVDHWGLSRVWTLDEFNRELAKSKYQTIEEVFTKQLALVPRCSGRSAQAITKLYPTPQLLRDKYTMLSEEEARKVLNIPVEGSQRKVSPQVSAFIHRLMMADSYES